MICRYCGKYFHYCIACLYDAILNDGFCSIECWENGQEDIEDEEEMEEHHDNFE
jgi:hypothetical protein